MSVAKAELAASTIAKANLLGKIKGELVSGSTDVGDLMFVSQAARVTVNGWLARANVTIVKVEKEITNIPVVEPATKVITAIASLEVPQEDIDDMETFVE